MEGEGLKWLGGGLLYFHVPRDLKKERLFVTLEKRTPFLESW